MAKKRHGGLGRGLDALIPQARPQEPTREESNKERPGGGQSAGAPVAQNAGTDAGNAAGNADSALSSEGSGSDSSGAATQSGQGIQQDPQSVSQSGTRSGSGSVMQEEAEAGGTGAVMTLRLSQIDPNRSQPRQKFEDESLDELADSIRQFGVLQPILVQKKGNRFEIIAGERRWRASRKAGLTEIPAIVREYSDQETLELSLIENIQREDLNPIEEAKAFQRLLEEFHLRQEDLAARVSKSRTAITNSVRLLKLDERVQDMLEQGQLSMGHARALIPLEIAEEQYLIAREIADRHLSVRDVEKLIKSRLSGKKKKKDTKKDAAEKTDPALELAYKEIEERLKQSLGTKTTIRHSGDGSGKLEIEFYSHEDLEKIVDMLT